MWAVLTLVGVLVCAVPLMGGASRGGVAVHEASRQLSRGLCRELGVAGSMEKPHPGRFVEGIPEDETLANGEGFVPRCAHLPPWRDDAAGVEPLFAGRTGDRSESVKRLSFIQPLLPLVDVGRARKLAYVDLGGRNYMSSVGGWFIPHYPEGEHFDEIHVFEADGQFIPQYEGKPGVTAYHAAAWYENTTLSFGIRRSASHVVDIDRTLAGNVELPADRKVTESLDVQAVDMADFLSRHFVPEDFVVMKMDIEGAEHVILPRLIISGAICLVDEIFLECHHRENGDVTKERSPEDCFLLLAAIRAKGVAAHEWF